MMLKIATKYVESDSIGMKIVSLVLLFILNNFSSKKFNYQCILSITKNI